MMLLKYHDCPGGSVMGLTLDRAQRMGRIGIGYGGSQAGTYLGSHFRR
jgi:hypothetical protein